MEQDRERKTAAGEGTPRTKKKEQDGERTFHLKRLLITLLVNQNCALKAQNFFFWFCSLGCYWLFSFCSSFLKKIIPPSYQIFLYFPAYRYSLRRN